MQYMTKQDLADKIDWEGGLCAFVNGYGLNIDELPPDTPDDIIAAFVEIINTRQSEAKIYEWLED